MDSWDALAGAIAGDVFVPGSPEYDAARAPANPRFRDVRPQAVVRCAGPADVVAALSFVRGADLGMAVRSGGHCFAGRSSTRGVLIDVSPMASVTVRGGGVRVGAGARLADLYDTLSDHGITIPAGCGPTVGIAGLTLGGGLGILGRRYGLTCDRLRAAEVVLADGRIVECDEHHDGELFWALRGAGAAGVGIVTALTFDPLPAPAMTVLRLTWPLTDAPQVVRAWQEWAPSAPDEVAASLQLTASGEIDQPPVVAVSGAMIGSRTDAAEQLHRLVAQVGVDPVTDELTEASHRETKRLLAADDADRNVGYAVIKSSFFARSLPAEAVAALVSHLARERVPGQARTLDFSPWGGAYNRVPPDATAFVHRGERFLLQYAAEVPADASTASQAAARRWVRESHALVHSLASAGVYPNFPDPDLMDPDEAYYGTNLARLRQVKATYDPDNVYG